MVTGIQRYRSSPTAVPLLSAQDAFAFRNMQPSQQGPLTGNFSSTQVKTPASTVGGALDTVGKAKDLYKFASNPSSFGASTGPISTAVNQFGASAFGLSPGLAYTAPIGPTLSGAPMASSVATAAPTLSGALGAAGIGAFTGSYIAKFTGGNSTGGSVGGGIGAGVGYAVGGPIGGVIGNVAGSLLGSKFGGGGVKHPASYLGNATLDTSGNITGGAIQAKHMGGDIPNSMAADFSAAIKNTPYTIEKNQGFGFAYDPGLFGKDTPARITVGRDAEKYNAALADAKANAAPEIVKQEMAAKNNALLKEIQSSTNFAAKKAANEFVAKNNGVFDYDKFKAGLKSLEASSLDVQLRSKVPTVRSIDQIAEQIADKAAPQISYNFNPNSPQSVQDTYNKIYTELANRGVLKQRTQQQNTNTTPAAQINIGAFNTGATPTQQASSGVQTQNDSPFTRFLLDYRSKQRANLA